MQVADEDIEEMFDFADQNKDGKLSYQEFLVISNSRWEISIAGYNNCFNFRLQNIMFRWFCLLEMSSSVIV